jgi:predicted DNA-binding transcriptional regulator YafY
MDRLERLINLMAALLEADRPLDRLELRRRVSGYGDDVEEGTFRRMFERDKEALRQMGVPLVIEPVNSARPELGEGYRIPRDRYELPDPGLESDELAALRLAVAAVSLGEPGEQGTPRGDGPTTARAALWKLGGGAEIAAPVVASLPGSEHLPALFAATAERQPVTFEYQGRTRRVEPWRLSYRGGRWYLSGFDRDRGDARMFRLDRFGGAPEADGAPGSFARPAGAGGAVPPPWLIGDEEDAVEAELLIDADQAQWAVADAGPYGQADHRPDGSVVLRFPVTNRAGFRSFVLGFLDHAEVLGPPELRQEFVAWLEAQAG